MKHGGGYIGSYAGQDVQNVGLPMGVRPPGYEAPYMEIEVESFWGLFVPRWVFGGLG